MTDNPIRGRSVHALRRPRTDAGTFVPEFDPDDWIPDALDRLLEGETLAQIFCDPNGPTKGWFLKVVSRDEELAARYAEVRLLQADRYADDLAELTRRVINEDVPPDVGRVAAQSLQWLAGVSNRRRYGRDGEVRHVGEVKHTHEIGISDRLTRARLRAIENSAEAPIDDGAVIEGTAVTVRTTDAGD